MNQQSPKLQKASVRPQEVDTDTLASDGTGLGKERDADEEQDEGRVFKSQKIPYQPSQQE